MRIKEFFKRKEMAILGLIVLMSIVLTIASSAFFRLDNIIDLLKSNVVTGIMAFGMLPVIISGGMDVSVSASIAAVSVVIGTVMTTMEISPVLVILIALICGVLVGVINGLIISKLKIPPIVTTLGTQAIILGFVLYFTNGTWINGMPDWFRAFGEFKLGAFADGNGGITGIPSQVLIFIAAGLLTWFVLRFTLIGRSIYAVGGNVNSAQRVGYNVDKTTIFIYAFCGLMVGIAALVHTSIVQQVDPNTFTGTEMTVISVVVIGGASIMGGSGSVFGTVLGTILWAVLKNGLIIAKIPTFWQKIVMGIVILVAVSIDIINRRRQERKLVRVDIEEK